MQNLKIESWKPKLKNYPQAEGLKLNPETKALKTCTQEFENWIQNTWTEIEFWNEVEKTTRTRNRFEKLNPKKQNWKWVNEIEKMKAKMG